MPEASYYPRILPLIDQLIAREDPTKGHFGVAGLFCFGPTIDDVQRWMPNVVAAMERTLQPAESFRVIPADECAGFPQLLDEHCDWCEPRCNIATSHTMWLPPIGFDLDRSCLPIQTDLDIKAIELYPIGLLLPYLQGIPLLPFNSLSTVPDAALHREDLRTTLAAHCQRAFRPLTNRNFMRAVETTLERDEHGRPVAERPISGFGRWSGPKGWRSIPSLSWRFHTTGRDSDAVTILGFNQPHFIDGAHLAMVSPDWPPTGREMEATRNLIDRFLGDQPRTEDDRVQSIGLIARGHWSPASTASVTTDILPRLGYALHPLRSVASRILLGAKERASGDRESTVFLWFEGRKPKAAMEQPENQEAASVFVLESADAPFLAAVLNNSVVQQALLERCYGPRNNPQLSEKALQSFEVPWPASQVRQEWRQAMRDGAARVEELVWEMEFVQENLDELAHDLKNPITAGAHMPLWSARDIDEKIIDCFEHARSLLPDLKESGNSPGVPQQSTAPRPPFPLAIIRRRLENASEPAERFLLAMDLAEVCLRLDALLCLASAERLDAAQIPPALRKQKSSDRKRDLLWSMGDWESAATRLRKGLELSRRQPGADAILKAIGANCSRAANDAFQNLVRLRNDSKGHGFAPAPKESDELCRTVLADLERARGRWGYLDSSLIFVPINVHNSRAKCEITRVILNGPHPEFERQTIKIDRNGPLSSLNQAEVYVDLDTQVLGLWPWVMFGASQSMSRETVWLLDGLKANGQAVYRSTESKRETMLDSEAGTRLGGLLGL